MSERAGATVTEVAASHSVYVSQPAAVAASSNRPPRRPPCDSHPIATTVNLAPRKLTVPLENMARLKSAVAMFTRFLR